jgi:hypothetical protein
MSAEKYPLTHAAGLRVVSEYDSTKKAYAHVVDANVIEAWLASAPVVYGLIEDNGDWICFSRKANEPGPAFGDTHSARLVCIEPLRSADTAEGLLREYFAARDRAESWPSHLFDRWCERARKLLGDK